jgi:hypothetical protein
MSFKPIALFSLVVAVVVSGCSVIKSEDPSQQVRAFLTEFQSSLAKSDQEILQYFRVKQSREAVLSVVAILQGKDKHVTCDAQFGQASIFVEKSGFRVAIPATFKLSGGEPSDYTEATLTIWLLPEDKTFKITEIEGNEFYQAFTSFKNQHDWQIATTSAIEERLAVYENARALEAKFDSVIWYTTYGKNNFFYVVSGEWTNYFIWSGKDEKRNPDAKMGLADSNGELIIPIAYDLIGTPGFEMENVVEVKKDGKVGYFDIDKKQLIVPAEYDVIIPYSTGNCFAIVKKDTVYGWVSRDYSYTEGFPDAAAKEVLDTYSFLPKNLRLKSGDQAFCEIPHTKYAGNGIIMPSTYLVINGLFDEIESGITTTSVPMNAHTEYKETKGTWLSQISDGLIAVITSMNERYLDGREEFYESNNIMFVNSKRDTVGLAKISGGELAIRSIDGSLLEVTTPEGWWFMENDVSDENNLTHYDYFAIVEYGSVVRLESKRLFPQTEFVKLDSSYLTGSFTVYNSELDREETRTFLSLKTIMNMRDEILSTYGYAFPEDYHPGDGNWQSYEPSYTADLVDSMNEVDKHNLKFLEDVIYAMKSEMTPDV